MAHSIFDWDDEEEKKGQEADRRAFHPQEQRILQIVKDAGVPIYAKPGFEADDLIATMARDRPQKILDMKATSVAKEVRSNGPPGTARAAPSHDVVMAVEDRISAAPKAIRRAAATKSSVTRAMSASSIAFVRFMMIGLNLGVGDRPRSPVAAATGPA